MGRGRSFSGLQRCLPMLVILGAIVTILAPQPAAAFSGSGAGTVGDPFEINSCAKLLEISNSLAAYYELVDDVDCTGISYTPIGTSGSPFTGSLDGNLQTISHVSLSSGNDLGVFGYTTGATLKNLKLSYVSVSGSNTTGSLVGSPTDGVISNVRADNTNSVTSSSGSAGGLIGIAYGTLQLSKSYYNGTVESVGAGYIGGLVSRLQGNVVISDSYSKATIITNSNSYAGGLVGANLSGSPQVLRSYAAVTFNGMGTYNGGLIGGFFGGLVQNSFSASDMSSAAGTLSGAMFGVGDGTSTNNYFDRTLANRSGCTGNGAAACTGVNVANADPNYFKSNHTNAPLDTWNFDYVWSNVGTLPIFSMFGAAQVGNIESTSSTITFIWQLVGLSGSGAMSGQELRYRVVGSGSAWTYLDLNASSGTTTLSNLVASTNYEVQMRLAFSNAGTTDWLDGAFTTSTPAASVVAAAGVTTDTLAVTGDDSPLLVLIAALMMISSASLSLVLIRQK
jgi:hypothetical protein